MADEKNKVRVRDNPEAPEIYVSKLVGSLFDGHSLTIILGALRMTPERTDEAPKQGDRPKPPETGKPN